MSNEADRDPESDGGGRRILRIGGQVTGSSGPLGVLGDILVDPVQRVVTHVVVEPDHKHLQARVVPIEHVTSSDDDGVTVDLDRAALLQLPRFSLHEFVPLGGPVDVGDDWEIGSEHVALLPYWGAAALTGGTMLGQLTEVDVDRVPQGECEVRRNSNVYDNYGRILGHVDGLVVDGDSVIGVVVRRGVAGFHHLVSVPISHVKSVTNESITLDIDMLAFGRLPQPSADQAPSGDSLPSPLSAQTSVLLHRVSSKARAAIDSLTKRSHPDAD